MQHVDHWEDQKVNDDQTASNATSELPGDEGSPPAAVEDRHRGEGGCPRCEQALGHAEVMGKQSCVRRYEMYDYFLLMTLKPSTNDYVKLLQV